MWCTAALFSIPMWFGARSGRSWAQIFTNAAFSGGEVVVVLKCPSPSGQSHSQSLVSLGVTALELLHYRRSSAEVASGFTVDVVPLLLLDFFSGASGLLLLRHLLHGPHLHISNLHMWRGTEDISHCAGDVFCF